MRVEPGTRVKLSFTATYPDGELFDTSSQEVAVEYDVDADKRFRPIVLEVGAEPAISLALRTTPIGYGGWLVVVGMRLIPPRVRPDRT